MISDATNVRVEFNSTVYGEDEDAGMVTFTLIRIDESERPVSVLFSTANGSAQGNYQAGQTSQTWHNNISFFAAPFDFTSIMDMLVTFQPSETQREVQVMIENDNVYEDNEDFLGLLTLPGGSEGVALGSASTATATIFNDDGKPL